MFPIILHLLLNPGFLIGLVVIALIAAGIYFTMGPLTLLKVATDIRTWFILAFFLLVLAYAHTEQRADALEQDVKQSKTVQTATTDGAKTTELRVQQKTKRQTQSNHLQESISHAQPGQAQDDLLDAIAQDRPDLQPGAAPVGVRKPVDGTVAP
jgi:membrane protein implicated in regulation of membrane protease activity